MSIMNLSLWSACDDTTLVSAGCESLFFVNFRHRSVLRKYNFAIFNIPSRHRYDNIANINPTSVSLVSEEAIEIHLR